MAVARPIPSAELRRRLATGVRLWEVGALVIAAVAIAAVGNWLQCLDLPQCELPYIHNWKLHYFLFNYGDLGFAKRALLGTILNLDPATTTRDASFQLIALAILLGFALLLGLLASAAPWSVRILLLASPAVFVQAGFDLARIDHLNYILVLAILLSGSKFAILAAPALPLFHEGAILIHLPLLLAAHWLMHGQTRALVVAAALSGVSIVAVATVGRLDPDIDVAALYPALDRRMWELFETVGGNIRATATWLSLAGSMFFATSVVMGVYLALLFAALRKMLPKNAVLGLPIWLVCFTPLAACAFGSDWGRWFSYVAVNIFILTCVNLLITRNGAIGAGSDRIAKRPRDAALAVTLLGPFGSVLPLPLLYELKAVVVG